MTSERFRLTTSVLNQTHPACLVLGAKLTNFCEKLSVSQTICVILQSEAEEEAGSAEEQPASNRLSHYTETVSGTVITDGCAFFVSGSATWLRKPTQAALPHGSPTDYANNVFAHQFACAPWLVSASRCSYEVVLCCKT